MATNLFQRQYGQMVSFASELERVQLLLRDLGAPSLDRVQTGDQGLLTAPPPGRSERAGQTWRVDHCQSSSYPDELPRGGRVLDDLQM